MKLFKKNENKKTTKLPMTGKVKLFFVPAMIWFTIVSGTGNTRQAFMLDLAALSIYVAYVLYVAIGLKADVAVCWTSDHVYAVFMLLFSFLYLKKSDWREKRL